MFTLRERKTRFLIGIKNAGRHAYSTSKTLILYANKSALVDSITLGNDTAFAELSVIGRALLNKKVLGCQLASFARQSLRWAHS